MENLIKILLGVSLVANVVIGYEYYEVSKAETQTSTVALPVKGDPMTKDLNAVLADLTDQKACSKYASPGEKEVDVNIKRNDYKTKMGMQPSDPKHYAIFCFEDIVKMMLENDASVINNAIVIYPTYEATPVRPGLDQIRVVCRAAQLTGTNDLKFSSACGYFSPDWCPDICPGKVVAGAAQADVAQPDAAGDGH